MNKSTKNRAKLHVYRRFGHVADFERAILTVHLSIGLTARFPGSWHRAVQIDAIRSV